MVFDGYIIDGLFLPYLAKSIFLKIHIKTKEKIGRCYVVELIKLYILRPTRALKYRKMMEKFGTHEHPSFDPRFHGKSSKVQC